MTSDKSEQFYHVFVLGLLVNLLGKYQVRSEPESGYGRIDLLLIPLEQTKRGIIIELKRQKKEQDQDVEAAAQNALEQIEKKKYDTELLKIGVVEIVKIGIGFKGKECQVLISK